MGKATLLHQPCLDQTGCGSSDALAYFENGGAFCHSCGKFFKPGYAEGSDVVIEKKDKFSFDSKLTIDELKSFTTRGFQERKIPKAICEFFNVKVGFDSDGKISDHYYPYSGGGYKHRRLPKSFTWIGDSGGLFGKDLFTGGGKRLVITEGEIDALSVAHACFEKYQKVYPVISISSATGTKDLLENRDWIRSFKEVVLCLDNDEKGLEATEKAIKIIGLDKIKIWKPTDCKDANEVLLKHGTDRINQLIWDAETYSPAGIIGKDEVWKQIVERKLIPSVPYPPCMEGVNTKIKGMRSGEIALFISGTGAGKSTITREIVIHLIETTKDKIGVISLEESPGETGTKLAGMAINRNPGGEDISNDDLKVGFDKVFGDDRIVLLDHQGSIKDESIVSQLEYMCLMGCKYLIIDHITILVSEGSDGLTGNEAIDKIMNDLLRLVKRHDVWVGLVSHLRKVPNGSRSFEEGVMPTMDAIRGSGSIKQVSFDIIAFTRNSMAADETKRNTIQMAVLKSRTVGQTGRVKGAVYTHATGRLQSAEETFDTIEDNDGGNDIKRRNRDDF